MAKHKSNLKFIFSGKIEKNASHWSDREIVEGRAFFQECSGRLVLDNIQPHDQWKYKCRVDFKKTPTNIYQINLNVIRKFFLRYREMIKQYKMTHKRTFI